MVIASSTNVPLTVGVEETSTTSALLTALLNLICNSLALIADFKPKIPHD